MPLQQQRGPHKRRKISGIIYSSGGCALLYSQIDDRTRGSRQWNYSSGKDEGLVIFSEIGAGTTVSKSTDARLPPRPGIDCMVPAAALRLPWRGPASPGRAPSMEGAGRWGARRRRAPGGGGGGGGRGRENNNKGMIVLIRYCKLKIQSA